MRLEATRLHAISHNGGFGNSLYDSAGEFPKLDLNFAANKNLTDSITGNNLISFTRATAGTYVGADGLVKTAVTNLLLKSQEISDTGSWSRTNVSLDPNVAVAPDGTLTADKLIAANGIAVGSTRVTQAITKAAAATTYTLSVFAKTGDAGTGSLQLVVVDTASTANNAGVTFSTTLGTITVPAAPNGSFSNASATITPFDNNWYRCSLTFTTFTETAIQVRLTSRLPTPGDGVSGLYVWGAQIEASSTDGEYVPTTTVINSAPRFDHNSFTGESLGLLVEEPRTNLSLYSEDFSNVYWTKLDCTITANESTAPDGTLTADLWTNTASPGSINNSIAKDTTARTYTASLWVKGTLTQLTVSIDDGTTGNRGRVQFNLSTNTVGSIFNEGSFGGTSGTLTRFSNSWVRVTVTTTTGTGTTIRFRPFFSGVGSILRIWGAQVEEGAFATSYIPTGASGVITPGYASPTVTRAADVTSITGANFGVTRTNYIRNNTMVGAVAGTPGTLPTNWGTAGSSALSTQIIGTGTDNEINYIDVRCFGTTAAVASPEIYFNFDVATAIPVAQNQTWTTSCYAKIVGGTQTGIIGGELYVLGLNSSSGLTEAAPANFNYSSLTGAFSTCRVSKTHTFTVATTVYSQLRIDVNFTAGGGTAVDFTLRIGMPQMEVGSVATAAIPTTTAAASVLENSWYNQTQGTVFAGWSSFAPATQRYIIDVEQAASANDRIDVNINTSNIVNPRTVVGGSAIASLSAGTYTANTAGNISFSYKIADYGSSFNGAIPVTANTAGSLPSSPARLFIGSLTGTNYLNGTIKRLTYWATRLANATLQAIATP